MTMDVLKESNLVSQAITIVSFIRAMSSNLDNHVFTFDHFPILDKDEREFLKRKLESAKIQTKFGQNITLQIVFATSENTRRNGPSPFTAIHVRTKNVAVSS